MSARALHNTTVLCATLLFGIAGCEKPTPSQPASGSTESKLVGQWKSSLINYPSGTISSNTLKGVEFSANIQYGIWPGDSSPSLWGNLVWNTVPLDGIAGESLNFVFGDVKNENNLGFCQGQIDDDVAKFFTAPYTLTGNRDVVVKMCSGSDDIIYVYAKNITNTYVQSDKDGFIELRRLK